MLSNGCHDLWMSMAYETGHLSGCEIEDFMTACSVDIYSFSLGDEERREVATEAEKWCVSFRCQGLLVDIVVYRVFSHLFGNYLTWKLVSDVKKKGVQWVILDKICEVKESQQVRMPAENDLKSKFLLWCLYLELHYIDRCQLSDGLIARDTTEVLEQWQEFAVGNVCVDGQGFAAAAFYAPSHFW